MKTILVLLALLFCIAFASKSVEYRSIDGSGNNIQHPSWGKFNTPKVRRHNFFDDKISVPYGGQPSRLPSARLISNIIFDKRIKSLLSSYTTNQFTTLGQFINHDMGLTELTDGATCEAFPIPIPKGDVFYDAQGVGGRTMPFCRSVVVEGTGTSASNPREFTNTNTGYLDLSNVYGSIDGDNLSLRAFKDGLMKTSEGPDGELLPYNVNPDTKRTLVVMGNKGLLPDTELFAAGDNRANEQALLMCEHTLWLREHNRRARSLPKEWSDEKKFQVARKWTIALYQHVVYNEYLPTLLGVKFPAYKGYNKSVECQADLIFTTAFFRLGHDQISSIQERLETNGRVIPDGNILLRDTFFRPQTVASVGIGPFIRGAISTYQQKMDSQAVDDIRNFLFSQGPVATDLIARNIQRAREMGLGSFNDAREAFGLPRYTKYTQITTEPSAVEALEQIYGSEGIDKVDIFVGCLLETKFPNSLTGETLFTGIVDQFEIFRNGDRFFYLNHQFSKEQLKEIKETTMGDIIARNTDSVNVPKYVFLKDQRTSSQIFDPEFSHSHSEPQHQDQSQYYDDEHHEAENHYYDRSPPLGKSEKN